MIIYYYNINIYILNDYILLQYKYIIIKYIHIIYIYSIFMLTILYIKCSLVVTFHICNATLRECVKALLAHTMSTKWGQQLHC